MSSNASLSHVALADPRIATHTDGRPQLTGENTLSRPAKLAFVVAIGAAVGILSFISADSNVAHQGHDLGKATAKFMARPLPAMSSGKAWVRNGPSMPTINEQGPSRLVIKHFDSSLMKEEVDQLVKSGSNEGHAKTFALMEEQLAKKEEQNYELAMRLSLVRSQIRHMTKDGEEAQRTLGIKSIPVWGFFVGLASLVMAFSAAWAAIRTRFGHGQHGSESALNSQLARESLDSALRSPQPRMQESLNAKRLESGKAAIVSTIAGSLASVPVSLLDPSRFTPQWELQADGLGVMLLLFGVVYRYAVRTDDNPMLKQGVVGAFVVTRAWALLEAPSTCSATPLNCGPPLGYFSWDMIGTGLFASAQTLAACAAAAFVIELCFEKGFIRRCEAGGE